MSDNKETFLQAKEGVKFYCASEGATMNMVNKQDVQLVRGDVIEVLERQTWNQDNHVNLRVHRENGKVDDLTNVDTQTITGEWQPERRIGQLLEPESARGREIAAGGDDLRYRRTDVDAKAIIERRTGQPLYPGSDRAQEITADGDALEYRHTDDLGTVEGLEQTAKGD